MCSVSVEHAEFFKIQSKQIAENNLRLLATEHTILDQKYPLVRKLNLLETNVSLNPLNYTSSTCTNLISAHIFPVKLRFSS